MSARSTLQVPLDLVTTSTGARARTKVVEIEGLSAPDLQSRLTQILEGTR